MSVMGTIEGRRVVIGSNRFLAEQGVDLTPLDEAATRFRQDGATAVLAGIAGRPAFVAGIADPHQESKPAALAALRTAGVHVVLPIGRASCRGGVFQSG